MIALRKILMIRGLEALKDILIVVVLRGHFKESKSLKEDKTADLIPQDGIGIQIKVCFLFSYFN
jgi:hypothetical protein